MKVYKEGCECLYCRDKHLYEYFEPRSGYFTIRINDDLVDIPFVDVFHIRTISFPWHDVYAIENERRQVFIIPCYAEEQLDLFYDWKVRNKLEEK